MSGHDSVAHLVHVKDNDGQPPIYLAIDADKLEVVRFLFDKGGELNSRTNEGDTLLHAAVGNGHIEAVKFILPKVTVKNPSDDDGDARTLAVKKIIVHNL